MNTPRWWPALVAVALSVPLGASSSPGASDARPLRTTVGFTVAYTGTISISRNYFATRQATGTFPSLGKSKLLARDSEIHIPEVDSSVGIVAGSGSGTLKFGKMGQLRFLYVFSGDPPDGYFIIYGGTGKLSRATGRGTLREEGSTGPGHSAPITDTFTGSVSF